ncbi:MAG: hypothetical protein LBT42_09345 [Tannerella sp.]|jgi:hypothetical protein|nr:hypothetical protein [Tannerella sp.]
MNLEFEIDKLTHSIENAQTGENYPTDILPFMRQDLSQAGKKNGWNFDWGKELNNTSKEVYKLVLCKQPEKIQGLVSLTSQIGYILMNLIESSPLNIGQNKLHRGVAGNLVAFVCKLSFLKGFEGYVAFDAKTVLINHYIISLGAISVGGQRMIIETNAAKFLINKYYPDFF